MYVPRCNVIFFFFDFLHVCTTTHCITNHTSIHKYVCMHFPALSNALKNRTCSVCVSCMCGYNVICVYRISCTYSYTLNIQLYMHTQSCRTLTVCNVRVAVCCSVLQCVAVCCSVLQCVAVYCSVLQCICSVLQCVAVCCSVL